MSVSIEDLQAMLDQSGASQGNINTVDDALAQLNASISQPQSTLYTNDLIAQDRANREGQRVVFIPPQEDKTPAGKVIPTESASSLGIKTLQDKMRLLTEVKDPTEKAKMMIDLEASAGEFISQRAKETRVRAEQELGIADLKKQLQVNEQLDRKDPNWGKFQSDSKITSAFRQRVMQSESQIDSHTQRLLKEDGELARLVKTIDGILVLNRGLVQKGEKKAEDLSALLASIPPDVRSSFVKMNPALQDDATFGAYVMQAAKGGKDRDNFDAIMSGAVTPENYLQAGLTGNTIALQLAATEQATRTGLPKEIIGKQLQSAYNFVNSPETFIQASTQLGLMNAKQAKAYVSKLSAATDKESQNAARMERLALVEPYLAALQKDAVDSNILNWSVGVGESAIHQAPGAASVIQELQAAGRPLTVHEFSKAYLSQPNLTPAEVSQRNQIIGDAYARTLERANRGIYGKGIDVAGATNKILLQNTLSKLMPGNLSPGNVGLAAAEVTGNLKEGLSDVTNFMLKPFETQGRTLRQIYEGFTGE